MNLRDFLHFGKHELECYTSHQSRNTEIQDKALM